MSEVPKPGSLTPTEKKRLARLKEELIFSGDESDESLPPISSDTIKKLEFRFNMGDGRETISREGNAYYRAYKVAQKYADYFFKTKEGTGTKAMFDSLQNLLTSKFPLPTHDAVAIGFFLVLDAFNVQFGEGFINSLNKIEQKEVVEIFNMQELLMGESNSVIERSAGKNKIPEDQVFLREFIDEFVDFEAGSYCPQAESGARLGFSVIESLWPRLKSGINVSAVNRVI